MRRVFFGAVFSAVFSAISASLYFTFLIVFANHQFNDLEIIYAFSNVGVFALPVAGFFGFVLGFIGAWIIPRLEFLGTKFRRLTGTAVLGAILGCLPPIIPRILLPTANEGEILGFLPCVVIGTLCASFLALLWSRSGAEEISRLSERSGAS